jgi:DNA modification methylase
MMDGKSSAELVDLGPPDHAPSLIWVDPNTITPNAANWRIHTDDQRKLVSDLITDPEIGWADVTLYNRRTAEFVNGHLRRDIAISKGLDRIPVLVVDWPADKQAMMHAALDLSTTMARPDPTKLAAIVAGARAPSREADEIVRKLAAKLGASVPPAPVGAPSEGDGDATGDDEGPSDAEKLEALRSKWGVERGQLWFWKGSEPERLHRLFVGDCTNSRDVASLMGDTTASMLFTSPPYGNQRDYDGAPIDWDALMKGLCRNLGHMRDSAQILVNLGLIHEEGEFKEYWQSLFIYMKSQGYRKFAWYVWDRVVSTPGDWGGRLAPSFEFVFHFNKVVMTPHKIVDCIHAGKSWSGSAIRDRDGSRSDYKPFSTGALKILDSVVRVLRATMQGIAHLHPAIFPPEFPEQFIRSFSNEQDIIYEPFLGSGTTALSCETCKRLCAGMEISPAYAALALERIALAGMEPRRLDA